jgi:lysozyme
MKAGRDAFTLIKAFEGLRLKAYQDVQGIWTIGYGHTGGDIEGPMVITRGDAERYLMDDVAFVERKLFRMLLRKPLQHEFDAMLSWCFNIGYGAAQKSTLIKLYNLGQVREAAGEFLRWNKIRRGGKVQPVQGLTLRRQSERELFVSGKIMLPASKSNVLS